MKHDPTIDEIRQACLEIQAGWSDAERLSRLRSDLRPTYTRADGVRCEIHAADYLAHHESTALARDYVYAMCEDD